MIEEIKKNLFDMMKIVMPIIVAVFLLTLFIWIPGNLLFFFVISSILLVFGISLFTYGADTSMVIMGKRFGNRLVKCRNIWIILLVSFIIGMVVTIAEPDLKVLADQVLSIPNIILVLTISVGVGIFLVLSSLRTIYGWDLNRLLFIGYTIVLILLFFVPENFVALAFDSGGITTGTISIPFIMTLGIGLAFNRTDKQANEDSFGLVALCSVGPIISVLLLGLFYNFSGFYNTADFISTSITVFDYFKQMLVSVKEVFISIFPILVVFVVFQILTSEFSAREIRKLIFGILVMLIGLVLFFVSMSIGFMDMGYYIGNYLMQSQYSYLLLPFSIFISYFISIAEPAVQILNEQVETITGGSITKTTMNIWLGVGVCVATFLSIIRIFTNTSFLYYIIPGQIISLILMFFTPKIFTAIAFDAGGAVGGTLTTAFLLPIMVGICMATGLDVLSNAFGIAALISLAPLITIQILGICYANNVKRSVYITELDDTIVDFDLEVSYD